MGRAGMRPSGTSLAESLAVLVILAIVALVALPRFSSESLTSKKNTCFAIKGNIEIQTQLWYRQKAVWPRPDLSDIGASPSYFAEGLPRCPVDRTSYTLDATTHRVQGHTH